MARRHAFLSMLFFWLRAYPFSAAPIIYSRTAAEMKLRHLLQRVFSSKAGPTSLPASVYELLHSGIPLQVQKVCVCAC